MNPRAVAVSVLLCVMIAATVHAGGFSLGFQTYTVELDEAFAKVPVAGAAAFDALDDAFADAGLSPAERATIRTGLDEGLNAVEVALADAPTLFPVPLLGGAIEIPLPLVVLDGVRISGAFLTDGLMRGVAELAGVSIPSPLVEVAFDEGGVSGSLEGDVTFSGWMARTELVTRFDALVAALDLALGVHLASGALRPSVDLEVPPDLEAGAAAALAALHLDGLTWTAFGLHMAIGVELGPPFLRFGATARFALPVTESSGWWEIGVGGIGGELGVSIRF